MDPALWALLVTSAVLVVLWYRNRSESSQMIRPELQPTPSTERASPEQDPAAPKQDPAAPKQDPAAPEKVPHSTPTGRARRQDEWTLTPAETAVPGLRRQG